MFTSCPKCALTLVVTTGDLRAAQGFVRCGRCSNVFNALANLTEDRSTADTTSATGQQRILQQPSAPTPQPTPPPAPRPPREVAESGTPEESPRYEDSSAVLTRAPIRPAPQTQFDSPPAQRAPAPAPPTPNASPSPFARPAQAPAQNAPARAPAQQQPAPAIQQNAALQRAPVQQPARQPQAPQQGFTQPAQQFSPSPQQLPSSAQFLPQPSQPQTQRGRSLPPPTAQDLDDIPDISLEFDADIADISQVFVQQPARRLSFDGNTGTFETLALKEPPPQEAEPSASEFDSQLRALAAQLAPAPQPQPQAPVRSAPAPAPAPARQTQPAPVQVAPQAKQAPPPPQNREPPPPAPRAPAPAPAPAPQDLDDIPIEDVEVVVRQSTGAPSASPPPARQQAVARQAPNAPNAEAQPQARPAPSKPPRPAQKKKAAQARRAAPASKGRSPEELIQAAAEMVKTAGRKRPLPQEDESMYADEPPSDVDAGADIAESFPTRIRRRAFEAIETDGAALRARIPSLSWGTAAVALSALFVLQVINHYRNELATSDRLRKPLTSLYSAFGVTLVPRWDIGAYEVRQLGALAGAGNLLTVRLSVKNGAKSAQPLPFLRVTVQDRYGNRIASRDVPPQVYSPKRARTLLNADSRIDAEVAFADPGQNAVGFEIDACLPTDSGRIACANDQIAR